jgi:predicted nucleic acid-binding protein
MPATTFVDTNILIYAHDRQAPAKHERARQLVKQLWDRHEAAISTQVLQEFYVNVTRKIPKPLPRARALELVEIYACWKVVKIDVVEIRLACKLEESHQLSFWDALVVAAAQSAGARVVLSEDLSHGQVIEGVRIQNPFVPV